MASVNFNSALIQERDAILLRPLFITETGVKKLTRGWKCSSVEAKGILEYLHDYASLKNSGAATKTALITDPCTKDQLAGWKGTWVQSQVYWDEEREMIVQELELLFSISLIGDLSALRPQITSENEILDPFGLKNGEQDKLGYVWKNLNPASRATCEAFSDQALLGAFPMSGSTVTTWATATSYTAGAFVYQSSKVYKCLTNHTSNTFATELGEAKWQLWWIYIDRLFREEENGTGTFTLLFQKVAWNAFAEASPDISWYDNYDTQHQRINEVWLHVTNTDDLTDLYTADTGYNVMEISKTEGDGYLTVKRVQYRQATGSEDNNEVMNPNGLNPGTITRVIESKSDFKTKPTISGTLGTAGVESFSTNLQSNGLWSSRQVTVTVAWTNRWTAAAGINGKQLMENKNASGFQNTQVHDATGVSAANGITDFNAGAIAADSGYVTLMSELIERANGERIVRRIQGTVYTTTSEAAASVYELNAAVAGQQKAIGRWWPRRDSTAMTTLTTGTGKAISDITTPDAYTHYRCKIQDNGDGTYDVYQVGIVPQARGTRWQETSAVCTKKFVMEVQISAYADIWAMRVIEEWRSIEASYTAAWTYATTATGGETLLTYWGQHCTTKEFSPAKVEYLASGKYAGFKYVDKGDLP